MVPNADMARETRIDLLKVIKAIIIIKEPNENVVGV